MLEVAQQTMQEDRKQQARRIASEKFQRDPDWVTFYRELLGVDGLIDQLFPEATQREEFEESAEFKEIHQMLAKLRERKNGQKQPEEQTRVITVRLPKSLHDALRHEAHNYRTSMNKLCISKLLQVVDEELVPSDLDRGDDTPMPVVAPPVRQYVPMQPASPPPMPMTLPMHTHVQPAPMSTSHRPFGIPAPMQPQAMSAGTF